MNIKRKKILQRSLCALLLVSMLVLVFSGCNTGNGADDSSDIVQVVRVIDDVNVGGKLTNERLELVSVRADALPEGTVSDLEEARGKYARVKLYAGDFVVSAKISETKPEGVEEEETEVEKSPAELGYVLITEYKEYIEGGSYSEAIKKAIEENPGKTLYFPDGTYSITEPIVIPAEPEKSVSIRMSNLCIIRPVEWTDPSLAMVRIGATEEGESTPETVSEVAPPVLDNAIGVSITGGCIYAMGMASGISIEGGTNAFIYNVSIKTALYGIQIKGNNYANIDNVNITGNDSPESTGVIIEGSGNNLSNMRIASISIGVKLTETGSDNILRNIHPLCSSMSKSTVGFWDLSDGNIYDVCYSDQFATGFLMESNTKSVYNGCFCYWWTGNNGYHVGFRSNGQFNSIVASSKVSHSHRGLETDAYLIVAEDGGQGVVLYPIVSIRSDAHNHVLEQYLKTVQP